MKEDSKLLLNIVFVLTVSLGLPLLINYLLFGIDGIHSNKYVGPYAISFISIFLILTKLRFVR